MCLVGKQKSCGSALPHQADKRQGAIMACGAFAVLPRMQDDAAEKKLIPSCIRFKGGEMFLKDLLWAEYQLGWYEEQY